MSAKSILNDIIKKYGTSEPIFTLRVSEDGKFIHADVVSQYQPNVSGVTDPVELALVDTYREHFSKWENKFIGQFDSYRQYYIMICALRKFYAMYSGYKNPKQTAVYKFLDCMDTQSNYSSVISAGIIHLYRYAYSIAGTSDWAHDKENPHSKNVLLILEK